MANGDTPGPKGTTADTTKVDAGTLSRSAGSAPGTLGSISAKPKRYSYSISGTVGALGDMLFTEATNRLPGTWYDRTRKTTQLRADEAALGLSEFFDADAKAAARRTVANIKAPPPVAVDIHFETSEGVERITVRGRRGSRSFRFDFKQAEKMAATLPKDADVFQPFYDTIDKILKAVIQVR